MTLSCINKYTCATALNLCVAGCASKWTASSAAGKQPKSLSLSAASVQNMEPQIPSCAT